MVKVSTCYIYNIYNSTLSDWLWASYFLNYFESELFYRDGPVKKTLLLLRHERNIIYSKLVNNPFNDTRIAIQSSSVFSEHFFKSNKVVWTHSKRYLVTRYFCLSSYHWRPKKLKCFSTSTRLLFFHISFSFYQNI